jgi:hypothetical protein
MTKISAFLAAALFFLAGAANATIYFAGGEDTSFSCIGTCGEGGSGSSQYRTAFARAAYGVQNSTTVADPPANRIQTTTFSSLSTLWMHGVVSSVAATTTSGEQSLILRSPDGVARILLRQTGTSGTLKASTRNAAATITDLATASVTFSASTPVAIDLGIVYGCTSGDTLKLYIGGTLAINYTGNLCTDAATSLNQLELAAISNNASGCNGGNGGGCWSEVIVSDSDTRGMALWTLSPQASGNTQSWTPNTVGNINPVTINDANSISTGSTSALSEWTTPTTFPSGTWNVLAVVQEARALVGTTGPLHFEWLVRVNSTNNVTGSVAPSTSFGNFNNQIWSTNPNTSSAWAVGDIVAGFNLGIESLP